MLKKLWTIPPRTINFDKDEEAIAMIEEIRRHYNIKNENDVNSLSPNAVLGEINPEFEKLSIFDETPISATDTEQKVLLGKINPEFEKQGIFGKSAIYADNNKTVKKVKIKERVKGYRKTN